MKDGALSVSLKGGASTGLKDPAQFAGYRGEAAAPSVVLLKHNGLHLEIVIDRTNPIGKDDPAGVADVVLEAAITTIQDCEDSIAAVDADDKVLAYRNWLGLMNGTLAGHVREGRPDDDPQAERRPALHQPAGGTLWLSGRSLMLIRNVGHHMYTDAVLDAAGAGNPGRLPRRRGHLADRDARPDQQGPDPQQPRRLGLHRQAEDARAGRGRAHQRAVRRRGGDPRPAAPTR